MVHTPQIFHPSIITRRNTHTHWKVQNKIRSKSKFRFLDIDDDKQLATTAAFSFASTMSSAAVDPAAEREQVLEQYRAKIREHREVEARLKRMREDVRGLVERYQKTEDDLSALQSVGQIIGDVLKRLDSERFIVKASSGPRYVVGCRTRLNYDKLKPGVRVALDMTTLTIMRILPREVDPTVFHMQSGEEDGGVSFSEIGGLNEQIRELREVIELPLTNPELFVRVGIKVRCRVFPLLLYEGQQVYR
jgi:ATP-dependent 26S proteasome regulatory subunit